MIRPLPRLLRDERGAALLEALISLPVFIAALAGIVALNGMYGAKLEAKSRARRLAWLQADSGECPAQSCRIGECGRIEGAIRAGGIDDVLAVRDGQFSLGSFLGDVGRYFLGKATNGVGLAQAATSMMVGSGRTSQHGVTTLLCNTTARHTDAGGSVLEYACRTGLRTTEYASEVCR
jgi:Flp pilus assembly pilin Flp